MELTTAYANTAPSIPTLFEGIQRAAVPERFTHDIIRGLGLKSSNDRMLVNVLKGLGFIDANAAPTQYYKAYKDRTNAGQVLAQQIRKAYKGLFDLDEHAQNLKGEELKGKFATITGKDDAVIQKMVSTFNALCKLADWTEKPGAQIDVVLNGGDKVESPAFTQRESPRFSGGGLAFSHTIYINLPASTDIAVYDAIFKSLKDHLLE